MFILAVAYGIPAGQENTVSFVEKTSPAYQYIKPNDKILSINDMEYNDVNLNTFQKDSFKKIIYEADNINVKIERNNEIINKSWSLYKWCE